MTAGAADVVNMRRRGDFMVFLYGFASGVWVSIVAVWLSSH